MIYTLVECGVHWMIKCRSGVALLPLIIDEGKVKIAECTCRISFLSNYRTYCKKLYTQS